MRLLVAGASLDEVCGTRDAAATLAGPLAAAGAEPVSVWWERRSEPFAAWAERLSAARAGADAVLWHYSPFTYSRRGIPTLVPRALRAFGQTPLVPFLHELGVRWGDLGLRGAVWAPTQRAALRSLVRRSRGCVVTTEQRREWLETRRWLPRRPLLAVPVHANIAVAPAPERNGRPPRVGVFGFRRDTVPPRTVLDALAPVLPPDGRLVLVGAPGPDSAEARAWRDAADGAGLSDRLDFTGVLPAAELSRALHSLDVVLATDPRGPASRSGTLAAALAHGLPVVAVDGPETWRDARAAGALTVASVAELGDAVARVLSSPEEREALAARARAFHDATLAPAVVAERIVAFLEGLL